MRKLSLLFLTLILTVTASAQENQKVAVIDTAVFDDKARGIKRLVQAKEISKVERPAEYNLFKKIDALENDINQPRNQVKSFCEKSLELQKLREELTRAAESSKAVYEKRYSMVVAPVVEKIREKLKEFSRIKGYAIIVDKSPPASLLIEGETDDITLEFIKFCNENFEKEYEH